MIQFPNTKASQRVRPGSMCDGIEELGLSLVGAGIVRAERYPSNALQQTTPDLWFMVFICLVCVCYGIIRVITIQDDTPSGDDSDL